MESKGPPPRKVRILTVGGTVGGERGRSLYRIQAEALRPDGHFLWIEDLNGYLSVTNDAERVARELADSFGVMVKVLYKDSMGNTDELVHAAGTFVGFTPARHMALDKPGGRLDE